MKTHGNTPNYFKLIELYLFLIKLILIVENEFYLI